MRNDAGMRCDVAREALSARLDGERPEVLAQQVDAHLESCRGCRTWLISAAVQTRRLASIEPGEGPDLVDKIMASIGAESAAASALDALAAVALPALGADRCRRVPGGDRGRTNQRHQFRHGVGPPHARRDVRRASDARVHRVVAGVGPGHDRRRRLARHRDWRRGDYRRVFASRCWLTWSSTPSRAK